MPGEGHDSMEGRPTAFYYSKAGRAGGEILAREKVHESLLEEFNFCSERYLKGVSVFLRPIYRSVLRKFRRSQLWRGPQRPALISYGTDGAPLSVSRNLFVLENMTPQEFAAIYPRWRNEEYVPSLAKQGLAPAPRARVVLLIREPWNQLASLMKRPQEGPPRTVLAGSYRETWLDYAAEFVGQTNYLAELPVVRVAYSSWFLDIGYRKTISEQLGVAHTDAGLHVVSGYGGGSSFDDGRMSGKAQKMGVQERWRAFVDNPLMRQLCSDSAVCEYAQKIFGKGPPELFTA